MNYEWDNNEFLTKTKRSREHVSNKYKGKIPYFSLAIKIIYKKSFMFSKKNYNHMQRQETV